MKMNKLKILLQLEIKRMFRKGKGSRKRLSSIAVMILVILAMLFYSFLFTTILVSAHQTSQLPLAFGLVLSVLTLITGFSNGNKNLFSQEEFEILYPMPLEERDILMAKFIGIYLDSLLYSFSIFIIPTIWFGVLYGPLAFVLNLLSILILPTFPSFLGVLLATQASKTFRSHNTKTVLQVLGMILFFAAYLFFVTKGSQYSDEILAVWKDVSTWIQKYYLPLGLFQGVFAHQSLVAFIEFLLLNGVLTFGLCYLITKNYIKIFFQQGPSQGQEKQKAVTFSKKSTFKTLYQKEKTHYFWRSNYITNTILSPLLILGLGVAAFFFKPETIFSEATANVPGFTIESILTYLLCFVAVNGEITYCSLSLEGENLEGLLAMPLSFKDLILPKVAFSMSLSVLPILFTSLVFAYVGKLGLFAGLFLVLSGFLANLFGNLVGIYFDIVTLDTTWKNDLEVIKQRFSGIFMSLAMVLPLFITWALTTIINIKFTIPASFMMSLAFIASIAIVYLMLEGAKDRIGTQGDQ